MYGRSIFTMAGFQAQILCSPRSYNVNWQAARPQLEVSHQYTSLLPAPDDDGNFLGVHTTAQPFSAVTIHPGEARLPVTTWYCLFFLISNYLPAPPFPICPTLVPRLLSIIIQVRQVPYYSSSTDPSKRPSSFIIVLLYAYATRTPSRDSLL